MRSKFSSQSKTLPTAVPVKGVRWISVEGFVASCVKSWFINCTGSISLGSSGKVSKELLLESVREQSIDCDSWSRPVRRSWAKSIRESVGRCGWRLTNVSKGVRSGNWTTVSPLCNDQGSLTIPGWESSKSEHSKDWTRPWCGGCLLEARVYCLWRSTRWASNWCIRVTYYSWCARVLFLCKFLFILLTNCGRRNNKITNNQKRKSHLAVLATTVRTVLVQKKKKS